MGASLAAVLLWGNVGIGGMLASDPNAAVCGTATFTYSSTRRVSVDYAVFSPGTFDLGSVPGSDSLYVYAYQMTALDGNARYISVGLDNTRSLGLAASPGHLGSGLNPNGTGNIEWFVGADTPPPSSARWDFQTTALTPGNSTSILYFTSSYESLPQPQWKLSTVGWGSIYVKNAALLPSPAPEPATLCLLIGGMAVTICRRRRLKSE
ncbi:MAG: PEP-CTERM sorting domain-containing protein [Phycisphaerae bacterium]